MKTVTALFLMTAVGAHADEIILKDGKKIEWTSIRSKDDGYEVETRQGTKITIKKSEVEKMVLSQAPVITPLTGATFTHDRKFVTADVLQNIDMKSDTVTGTWKKAKAGIQGISDGKTNSRIQFSTPLPEEYDFALTMERKEGEGDFEVGMVASGKQFELAIDAERCTLTGLVMSDNKLSDPTGCTPGALLPVGIPKKLLIMVRKGGVLVRVDGKDVIVWAGDCSKLSIPAVHAVRSKDTFFFACYAGTYEISKATLTFAKN